MRFVLTARAAALLECLPMRQRNRPSCAGPAPGRLFAAVALLVLCLPASGARAQSGKGEYVGTWSAAASLGYAVPNTDEYDNAVSWRFAGGYSPAPQFEFDLEVGGFSSSVSQPDADGLPLHTIASGRLGIRPVCLTVQYRTPLPEALSTLVLFGGVGYYFIDYEMDDEPRAALAAAVDDVRPDQAVDDDWGFHVGAGLEYALTERVSLAAETRYLFLSPPAGGTTGVGTRFGGTLDLNAWFFSGGVKVAF